ncbi:EpsG family protein [Rhodothermus profundi]|uniref:EpsG family protein n=1 Tax=Rhodothermus profundi TaxID=633813 RepID=A0A1M6VFP2_9BACT|nr:EpsG family protein [Rhodothermus profundi]SHK80165.1 EpsG family protein [Rhodothermus profundi]
MIYLIGWLSIYYYHAISFFLRKQLRPLAIGVTLLLSLVAVLRGSVGTDTAVYERLATRSEAWSGIEPAFWILMYIFNAITQDPVLTVRAFSGVLAVVLMLYIYRSDEDELFFLMSFFMPLFFYNFSMNVIRVGIAFSILLLALQEDRRGRTLSAMLLGGLSVMFHYSMIFSLFYLWFNQEYKIESKDRRSIMWMILLFVVMVVLVVLNENYFLAKLAVYARLEAPSLFSGISRIMLGLVLLTGVFLSSIPATQKKRIIYSSLFFMIFFFGLGIYVTPRLLDMVNLLIPIAMLRAYRRIQEPMDRTFKGALLLAGLGGAIGMYRYMLYESFWSPSPFLPYHTLFAR